MKRTLDSGLPLYLAGIGILASLLMFCLTTHGPGVSPDSTIYIETAKSLHAGNGFSANGKPMTHYPPGYPLLLATASLFRNDITQAARLLHALLFGINTTLIALAIYLCAGRNIMAIICAPLIFISSAPILGLHSMAWSEPPFLSLSLAALILFSMHMAKPRLGRLIAASIFLSLAMATRYVGVTLLPPIIAGILFLNNRSIIHRIRDCTILGFISCMPLAIWFFRNLVVAETATNRKLTVHLITLAHFTDLADTLYRFVLLITIPTWLQVLQLGLLAAAIIVALVVQRAARRREHQEHSLASVFQITSLLFCVTYVIFLIVSVSFIDALTPLDSRILSPVFVFLLLTTISLCWHVARVTDKPLIWQAFLLCFAFSVTINAIRAMPAAISIYQNGRGYTASRWINSDCIDFIKSLSNELTIYSNRPDAIRFLIEKKTSSLPHKRGPYTRTPNDDYDKEMKAMCQNIGQKKAIIVYFQVARNRQYLPTQEELESTYKLSVSQCFTDGAIYSKETR